MDQRHVIVARDAVAQCRQPLVDALHHDRVSGNAFLKCCSSWSPHVFGTSKPRRLPTVTLPTNRHPAMDAWTTWDVVAEFTLQDE